MFYVSQALRLPGCFARLLLTATPPALHAVGGHGAVYAQRRGLRSAVRFTRNGVVYAQRSTVRLTKTMCSMCHKPSGCQVFFARGQVPLADCHPPCFTRCCGRCFTVATARFTQNCAVYAKRQVSTTKPTGMMGQGRSLRRSSDSGRLDCPTPDWRPTTSMMKPSTPA